MFSNNFQFHIEILVVVDESNCDDVDPIDKVNETDVDTNHIDKFAKFLLFVEFRLINDRSLREHRIHDVHLNEIER